MIRLRRGWSQQQLAARMRVPRTHCSKCETGKTSPTLRSLRRIADALNVTVSELLSGTERTRQDEVRSLVSDAFLAEFLPFLPRLSQLQRDGVLVQVRDMATRPRRTA